MKSSPSPLPYPSPADSLWLDAFPCPSAPTLLSGYFARFNLARLSVSAKLRWCKEPPTIRSSIPVPESHVKSLKLTIRYRVDLSIFQLTRTTLVCVIQTTVNRSRLIFIRQRASSVITGIFRKIKSATLGKKVSRKIEGIEGCERTEFFTKGILKL